MGNTLQLIGGSVPKGIESHMKERKETRITDIVKRRNNYAEAKHRTNHAASGTTRLLRRVSAARTCAQVRRPSEEFQGDARLLRDDGGHHATRLEGTSQSARQQPPTAPTMRQPLALMDATATAQARHHHPDVQRLPHTLREYTSTTNQIPQINGKDKDRTRLRVGTAKDD